MLPMRHRKKIITNHSIEKIIIHRTNYSFCSKHLWSRLTMNALMPLTDETRLLEEQLDRVKSLRVDDALQQPDQQHQQQQPHQLQQLRAEQRECDCSGGRKCAINGGFNNNHEPLQTLGCMYGFDHLVLCFDRQTLWCIYGFGNVVLCFYRQTLGCMYSFDHVVMRLSEAGVVAVFSWVGLIVSDYCIFSI